MGGQMESWLHEQSSVESPQFSVAINQDAINGLDISAAVSIHSAWKQRLVEYVNGTFGEALDEETIEHDDVCALGKWIYADGNTFFASLPEYQRLKAAHAAFHIAVGDIVRAVNANCRGRAEKMLLDGPFAEYLRDIELMLVELNAKLSAE